VVATKRQACYDGALGACSMHMLGEDSDPEAALAPWKPVAAVAAECECWCQTEVGVSLPASLTAWLFLASLSAVCVARLALLTLLDASSRMHLPNASRYPRHFLAPMYIVN